MSDQNYVKWLSDLKKRIRVAQVKAAINVNVEMLKDPYKFDFMPEFIGKQNFYVSAADELLKGDDDNPSIGILLCKDKDSSIVEWSLRGITTPLGVASYQLQEVYDRTMLEMKLQASKENED